MTDKKYVVLRSIETGHVSWTGNHPTVEYGYTGERWYDIIGYADTKEEATEIWQRHFVAKAFAF